MDKKESPRLAALGAGLQDLTIGGKLYATQI